MRKNIWIILILFLNITNFLFSQNENVVVEIGKYKITIDEFENELKRYGKSQSFRDKLDTLTEEGKKRVLENMIRENLFYIAGEEEGIKLSSEEEEQINRLKRYIIIRKYITEKLKEKPVTEEEMKDYYEKNKKEFVIPEKRKASHIIVSDENKAKELLKKIKEGADFSQIAKENNIDGSKNKGGDLGWISKGYMIKEFEEVAFSLKKGEISDVIKTKFGYHIIKVEDIKPEEERNFEEVKESIRKKIEEERIKQLEEDLKKKYNVKVNYEAILKK
jgi:peptidyl-prolyl cis-trans isomerase C